MADKNVVKHKKATRRKSRVRGKVFGTPERPRLTVAKSLKNTAAQIVDDVNQRTLVGLSTESKEVRDVVAGCENKVAAARLIGKKLAELATGKGIDKVVFDRNQYLYHGRIKAVADGAREGGLKF